jgi:hypothetical protein
MRVKIYIHTEYIFDHISVYAYISWCFSIYICTSIINLLFKHVYIYTHICFYTPHWKMAFTMSGASKPLIPIAVSDVQAKLPTRVWGVPSYPMLAASGQNHSKSRSQNHLVIGKWDFCVSSCQAAPDFACDQITWFQLKGIPKIPKFFWVIWKLSFTSARTCATWV